MGLDARSYHETERVSEGEMSALGVAVSLNRIWGERRLLTED